MSAPASELRSQLDNGDCWIGVRPEDVHIEPEGGTGIPASVYVTEPLGGETVVDLHLDDRVVKALAPPTLPSTRTSACGRGSTPSACTSSRTRATPFCPRRARISFR